MNTADATSLLLYIIFTWSLGHCLFRGLRIPRHMAGHAEAYLLGQLGWLLLVLLTSLLTNRLGLLVWAIGGIATLFQVCFQVRAIWRRDSGLRPLTLTLLAVLAWCAVFPDFVYSIVSGPLVAWDAWAIWFFHGKVLFVHNGLDPEFFTTPRFLFSHQDYPLLIPAQAAVTASLRGCWSEMAVKAFLGANVIAYLSILHKALIRRGWSSLMAWSAAACIVGFAAGEYVNGYADNHYALPLALGAFLLLDPGRIWDPWSNSRGVLLATCALNVKNEAGWYAFLVFAGAVLMRIRSHRDRPQLAAMLRLAVPGLLASLCWFVYKHVYGIEGDLNLSRYLSCPWIAIQQIWSRAGIVFAAMLANVHRNYFAVMFGVVALLTGLRAALVKKLPATPPPSVAHTACWGLYSRFAASCSSCSA